MPRASSRRTATALLSLAGLIALSACGGEGESSDGGTSAADGTTIAGVRIEQDDALHAALPTSIREAGEVRVATDVPYPPFEMFVQEGDSQLTGLDYDLGQALAAKLGVDFTFTPQKFDGIVPAIQAGKFDVAMSAITDTEERQEVVDFVDYSVSGSGILVAEGNPEKIRSLDDLCGKKVGVQAATNQLDLLEGHQSACEEAGRPEIDIRGYPKDSDAQLALRSGQVVADVLTKPAAGWTAKTADDGKAFDLVEDPAATGGYNATPNGIAVTKDLPELTEAIRLALQQLMDEGTAEKIFAEYGVASIALDEATVNAGKE
ncbi:ABC transporter substrate-binding protein [Streptomyces sp. GSL17-111]|uniref:ABC transporter substrate-binding protein n=1 Tax=Streptomyces sp. GSL17-111 TaxID=3121596 RepID=UPI0030F4690A